MPDSSPENTPPAIDVVAGLIRRHDRFLLAQRTVTDRLGPVWEFPGGKVEPGETRGAALVRELREELGIEVVPGEQVAEITHDYPERRVCLHFILCLSFSGEPSGLDGQKIGWWTVREMEALEFSPPDRLFQVQLADLIRERRI
ncbi:MAG: (deoxy)nucleoside triphosphate pyrophosphohydrolase [bacterium]|nr:(deoxy)nucleoside triphosphate pyrophosphohydrolase [bacterium]